MFRQSKDYISEVVVNHIILPYFCTTSELLPLRRYQVSLHVLHPCTNNHVLETPYTQWVYLVSDKHYHSLNATIVIFVYKVNLQDDSKLVRGLVRSSRFTDFGDPMGQSAGKGSAAGYIRQLNLIYHH